jgi:hypothetical protein
MGSLRRFVAAAVGSVLSLLGACGTVRFEGGRPFDPVKLDTVLVAGVSIQSDVRAMPPTTPRLW